MTRAKPSDDQSSEKQIECGVIMPISAIGDCNESHWAEVLQIVTDAVSEVGFNANIVSNADEITVIQKTIIQNIYNNPIVVCDVSEKNSNVMFELGMRLAFDKPTVIIKDDRTSYSFDTSIIEHIEHPRDLRFSKMVDFKRKLASKVLATWEKSKEDSASPFLGHFGQFKVAQIDEKEVSPDAFILEQLHLLNLKLSRIESQNRRPYSRYEEERGRDLDFCLKGFKKMDVDRIVDQAINLGSIVEIENWPKGDHAHISVKLADSDQKTRVVTRDRMRRLISSFQSGSTASL